MTKRLVAIFGAAVIVFAACTSASPSAPAASGGAPNGSASAASGPQLAPPDQQKLRLYLSDSDPSTMNPSLAQDAVSIAVQGGIYRGLMYYDKDLKLVPEMAKAAPTISADGKTMTFTLKDGLKYSDGNPIVAGDFVRAFQRLTDPLAGNPYGYEACPVVGADALLGSEGGCPTDKHAPTDPAVVKDLQGKLGVEAPDDKTFIIHLAEPALYFTSITAMWITVPQEASQTKFDEASDLVASGPFMMKDWTHNSQITLVPNPNWSGDVKPTLQEIDLMIGGDPEAALASYEQGSIDAVFVPPNDAPRIKADASRANQYTEAPTAITDYYDFANCGDPNQGCPKNNTKDGKSATTNKNFRAALTEAIDLKDYINIAVGGVGVPAHSMIMPGIPGYDESLNPYPFNLDKAKTDMATALKELGVTDTNGDGKVNVKDLGTFKFGYNCNAGHLNTVVYLEEHWRLAFGFDQTQFDISCTDFKVFLKERTAGTYNISRDAWGADFPNAVNQLDGLFTCGGGNNDNQYCNADFDALLKKAAGETDPAAAVKDYQDAQKLMVNDAAVLFLRFRLHATLIEPYVTGVSVTTIDSENPGDRFYETIQILQH